jgi:TonB family protein
VPPKPAPPQRAAARPAAASAPGKPAGPPAQAAGGQSAASRAGGADNGAAWLGKLKQWWDVHSFYPKEAAQTNESGDVRVRIVIAPDGRITSVEVVQGSGSSVLDAAAVAVFRGANLPPPPPGTPAQPFDRVVTVHYRPSGSGG